MEGDLRWNEGVVLNRAILADACTAESAEAYNTTQDLATNAMKLSHPRNEYAMVIVPDASKLFCRSYLTHVPQDKADTGIAIKDMSNEPRIPEWSVSAVARSVADSG